MGFSSGSNTFTAIGYGATISGFIDMAYNGSPVEGLTVKVLSGNNSIISSCQTESDGSYLLSAMLNVPISLVVESQTVMIDGDMIAVAPYSLALNLSENTTQNIALEVAIPVVNADNCTFIGSYEGHEYWRSNWSTYWHYMNDDFNNRGGHHVTIDNLGESQFINQYILQDGGAFHLGYVYDGSSWSWVDDSPTGFTNWSPGNPDGNSQVSRIYNDGSGNVYWDDVNHWEVYYCGIMESYGQEIYLKPKAVTNLNIQQQRDFTINLSWTNPSEVVCGLNINSGFQVVIKRNGEIIHTVDNCLPGQALSWQEFVLTGRHTYTVYAVNEYGESDSVSQSVSYGNQVQGVALLNNLADHSGIKVKFIADPSTPAAVSDSTYTNVNGFYSINLTIGRYTVVYTKTGYLDASYYNYMHSEPTDLPEQTLEYVGQIMNLSGSLSGTLTNEYTYLVPSQIWVDNGNTLVLEPGVKLYFKNGIGFDVNGTLSAIGTLLNPVVFSSVSSEIRGDIWLNNSTTVIERCEFTKGTYGLRINSDVHVSYSKIHHNNIGISFHGYAGAACLVEYNELYNLSEHGVMFYSNGAPRVEHNEFFNNTMSGHIMYVDYSSSAQFSYSYVHHNSTGRMFNVGNGYENLIAFNNNIIENNIHTDWLFYNDEYRLISSNEFSNNLIRNNTGGDLISLYSFSGTFSKNLIYSNSGSVNIYLANWLYNDYGCRITVKNNTIINNSGNGLNITGIQTVKNNIIAFNGGTELSYNSNSPTLKYNLIYDSSGTIVSNPGGLPFLLNLQATNANGTPCDSYYNISTDPLFYDYANDNFNLLATSPCINAGDPASTLDPDGTIADMGALYYDLNANSHAQIAIPLSLYNFQSLPVGESLVWNCPVRNTGTDPLIISSIELSNPAFYLVTGTRTSIPYSLTINPNETGYIPIGFAPSAVADYADTLKINSNALMNPQVSIRLFGAGTLSSSVTMAMPQNTTVNVLSDFQLPLTVSDTIPYNILSYNMSLTFDPGIFEFIEVETTGTMSEDWFVEENSSGTGVLYIGGAGTIPLSGSGNLFKLNFHTLSGIADGTESFINISQVVFNEGGLSIQGCFASVTIRNIIYGDVDDNLAIQAYDAALTMQYSVMMDPLPLVDPRPWVDWRKQRADVSGDGNIYAYDASLILQRVVGIIDSFPAELGRLAAPESTVEIAFYNNQLILSSPDYSSLYGLNLTIPNPNGLAFGSVQLADAFQDAMLNQYSVDNTWYLAIANITPPQGSGTICIIPLIIETETQLTLTMVVNESSQDCTIDCLPLAQPENPVVSINYLAPNSPNPFNPSTTIYYGLKEPAQVELAIYNIKGQKVKTLVSGAQQAGSHSVIWFGKDDHGAPVGTGIYFSRIRIGNNWTKTQKMMLMK